VQALKKTQRCGSSARLVFGYKGVFFGSFATGEKSRDESSARLVFGYKGVLLVLSPQAKNPGSL